MQLRGLRSLAHRLSMNPAADSSVDLMDPASHRPAVVKLAQKTEGRAFSVRYRLAPQHPFPAALLDCIIAYLSLIYPPPGSFHEPVNPSHIVFAGDSAGGNMCLAVLLFLLHLKHTGQATVQWHGRQVEVPLPGGVAANSPWADLTHCLPSWHRNAHYDYLPSRKGSKTLYSPPPCGAWPSDPPRADLFCDNTSMCHPLTSPLAARVDAWKDAPPMFFCYGEEMLGDEGKVIARRAQQVGVKMWYEEFEAMPHVFAPIFEGSPVSQRCFDGWAAWIKKCVEGKDLPVGGVRIAAKTLKEDPVDLATLCDISDEDVWDLMDKEMERRVTRWKEGQVQESASGI